jgi:hypothetical protein
VQASLMMTPWGRNMQLDELFYKVVFDGYLFIAYFIVQHNGVHNFTKLIPVVCYSTFKLASVRVSNNLKTH